MPHADADLRGQLLDSRYFVEECIGRGGMGVVWRVRHAQTRQLFALKTIRGALPQSKKVIRRLLHEARATAAVKSRHVVRIVDVEPDYVHAGAHLPYIVMELLEGENLSQFLDRTGTVTPSELVWVMRQVSQALASAHARGIVHRDLKPSNVFLAREDDDVVAKVCDFGIAKLQGAAIADLAETGTLSTATGELLGTPRYMAPEQLRRSANEGQATDQWAFALIAFRALTGRNYFGSANNVAELVLAIVHEVLPIPSTQSASFPAALDEWFARSCERDPSARFRSIEEQQAALESCLGNISVTAISGADLRQSQPVGDERAGRASESLRGPARTGQPRRFRRTLFYVGLGGAAVFALAGTQWIAKSFMAHADAAALNRARPVASGTPAFFPARIPSAGYIQASTSMPFAHPVLASASPPPTSAGPASAGSASRPTQRKRNSARLPQGTPCTRSNQCESSMCAAEVCQ